MRQAITPRKITFISAYYENPTMLKMQLENFKSYSRIIKDNLELIFVDDCSPLLAKIDIVTGCYTRLFRSLVDIRWNQDFCRNLAVSQAVTPWLLLTDIDHLIPESVMRHLMLSRQINEEVSYRFGRVTAPENTHHKPHPNTWFMTKEIYKATGGYDERFAGYYGTDGDFRSRVKRESNIELLEDQRIIRVPREYVADASTVSYGRKEPMDKTITDISKVRKTLGDWVPLTLLTPWKEEEINE